MAVTRNNLSMKMKGRVGAYTFYTTTGGRQVARIANNGSNYGESAKRTVAMQTRRTKWGNVVSFFRMNRDLMSRAFERKGNNLSDYNRYMQLNIPIASVALTRDAFMKGICVLQEYTIADGSLPEITHDIQEEDGFTFNLLCTLDGELADYSIKDISLNLMEKNPQILEGDQLTFVSWTNADNVGGGLRLYRYLVELTIDRNSTMSFGLLKNSNIVASINGKIIIQGQGSVFGQAIIHSRSVGGNLLVSPARIALSSPLYVAQFSDSAAVKKAIDSYGVDAEKLLEPGSPEQPSPAPIPSLAKISSVITPAGCATFKIIDSVAGVSWDNETALPIGSIVEIRINSAEGYSVTMEPELTDPENYEVVGDITFNIKGTPTT